MRFFWGFRFRTVFVCVDVFFLFRFVLELFFIGLLFSVYVKFFFFVSLIMRVFGLLRMSLFLVFFFVGELLVNRFGRCRGFRARGSGFFICFWFVSYCFLRFE